MGLKMFALCSTSKKLNKVMHQRQTKTGCGSKMFSVSSVLYHSQCCIIQERLTLSPPGVERSHCQSRTPVTVINCVYCTVAWHISRKCSQHWNTSQPLKTCLPEWFRMRRCKTCQGPSLNPSPPTPLYLYLLPIIMLFLLWLLPYFITSNR